MKKRRGPITRFIGDLPLRFKLVICFLVLLAIPVFALGANSFVVAKQNLERQNDITMENNLSSMVSELEYRFQREETYMKYLAYNLNFREVLESDPIDRSAVAMELNESVEPILWYYIVSSDYVKGIDIYTSRIESPIGQFLQPKSFCSDPEWYDMHLENLGNLWTYNNGELYASRSIIDTDSMNNVLAVMRVKFFFSTVMEPVYDVDYISNGVIVLSEETVVCSKATGNEELDALALERAAQLGASERLEENDLIMLSAELPTPGWKIFYYVDRELVLGSLTDMLRSTYEILAVCLLAAFAVIWILSTVISRRVLRLRDCAESVAKGDLNTVVGTQDADEIGVVFNSIGTMARELDRSLKEIYGIRLEQKAAELKALQAQINPHFLYNSLSSIKWRAIKQGNDDISELTGLLAKFYRTSLNNGKQLTTVELELENIRSYIELQRMAHDNSFGTLFTVDEEALPLPMLNFILQPIVENAIKHGIDLIGEQGKGLIEVECALSGEFIEFRVYNNGALTTDEELQKMCSRPGKGYGIINIRERIELYYGGECGVFASVAEDGRICFTVKILKRCEGMESPE